jgi:predicted nucleic acid-binding protein
MVCIIVNDASCLIDLHKGQLLHVMTKLPYRFIVPLPIRRSELLSFTDQEWRLLDDGGIETYDLPPTEMRKVLALRQDVPKLSVNDCFCLVSTQNHDDAILLTGDQLLRSVAASKDVPVHGVLWLADRLFKANACETDLLIDALTLWREDRTVFLPKGEIDARLRRFARRG